MGPSRVDRRFGSLRCGAGRRLCQRTLLPRGSRWPAGPVSPRHRVDRGTQTPRRRGRTHRPPDGLTRTVAGHVEIRWSHGRFAQPPEAKVYLDTPMAQLPGYHQLVALEEPQLTLWPTA